MVAAAGLLSLLTNPSAEDLLQKAQQQFRDRRFDESEMSARQVLRLQPSLEAAQILLGRSLAGQQNHEAAVEALLSLNAGTDESINALVLCADLQQSRLHRLEDAEQTWKRILEAVPDHIAANEQLAHIYSLCGCRDDAIPHILKLVRLGRASDLLFVLSRESGAINDPETLASARQADPQATMPLIGLARIAEQNGAADEGIALCRQAVKRRPDSVAAQAELGRQLLLASKTDELLAWRENLPEDVRKTPRIQIVLAAIAVQRGELADAFPLCVAAARAAPDSRENSFRMSQLLFAAGDQAAAQIFVDHLDQLRHLYETQDVVLFSGVRPVPEDWLAMIDSFRANGRLLEAWGWAQLAVQEYPADVRLQTARIELERVAQPLPLQLVPDQFNPAFQIDVAKYTLQNRPLGSSQQSTVSNATERPRFEEQSVATGMLFEYQNGTTSGQSGRMFEYTGGGVGAIDFDLDAWPDVVLSQGGQWENRGQRSNSADVLMRNLGGTHFQNVSDLSGFGGHEFAQGVAVGDLNQDGAPDIVVAGIETARFWQNLGDGTFMDGGELLPTEDLRNTWFTSCAIADLNSDGVPDVYLTGYLQNHGVLDRTCPDERGRERVCPPSLFDGVPDRILLNSGDGTFEDTTHDAFAIVPDGKGLGVLVFSADDSSRPMIYVANDTTPNFLWQRSANDSKWTDGAFAAGTAVSIQGKSEGSMGIAFGDADADGRSDLVVTNFLYEGSAFYRGMGNGSFLDQRNEFRFQEASADVLGFGAQFLDADLDGREELFVGNGHIDDLRDQGKPWKMRSQLFRTVEASLTVCPAAETGLWFESEHLSRAAIRCDWNRDGRPDLIVGQILEPTAMLTNVTPTSLHWLAVTLTARTSERDAVCSRISIETDAQVQHRQVTAGDGYQCSCEKTVLIGLGGAEMARITIHWPSGRLQTFSELPVDRRIHVVEGRPPLVLPK
ncbi:MAG: VCBS repeat-containing protein [Planctomycetaceae bacterium]|nr:VCBS repeat-containing protein [Planctomycetaceae bacterium]